MNRIAKKKVVLFAWVLGGAAIFAQTENAIALPDVTTVVSGGALTAGKDAVPDYHPIMPTTETARVDLPQVSDDAEPETVQAPPATESTRETKFRLGGGVYVGFPLGSDIVREKIAGNITGELPLIPFVSGGELGVAAHVLLGAAIGASDVDNGFEGDLSAEFYVRIPIQPVFLLQPAVGYGVSLTVADHSAYFDSQFLLACSARFVPPVLLDGALEFAVTPLVQLAPFCDYAVCTLGFRMSVLIAF